MPSTPTARNRLIRQGAGENANTWGGLLNTQALDMIDEALDGFESIPVTGNLTLSSVNFTTDQARKRFLEFTGIVAATITLPGVSKLYFIRNATTQTLTFTTGGATNASIAAGKAHWIVCTGPAVYKDTTVDDATTQATNAATSATNSAASATNSANSATSSATSATNSANSATASANSATLAQNWAISTTTVDGIYFGARKYAIDAGNSSILASEWAIKTNGTVDGTNFSAKYWAGQSSAASGIPTPLVAGAYLTNNGTTASWVALGNIITRDKVATSDLYAWTADRAVTADVVGSAFAPVSLTDAATVVFDWTAGYYRTLTATAGIGTSRALGNPTNVIPGSSRIIYVVGADATARTLTFGTNFKNVPIINDLTSTVGYAITVFAVSATHLVPISVRAL